MKRLVLVVVFLLLSCPTWADTLYWYGGSGNWSDYTNHWSKNSGNIPPSPALSAPTVLTDTVTDALSNTVAYVITVDTSAICKTAAFGAPLAGNLTITTSAAKTNAITFGGNITITGTPSIGGASSINRLYFQSNVKGTARTMTTTGATVTFTNMDFQDITGTPALDLSAITGLSGNAGGNTGITFTTAAPQYWQHPNDASSHNFSEVAYWFLGSGGTGGAGRVPLPQDDCNWDANSFRHSGDTFVADMPRLGRSHSWVGVTNNPTLDTSTTASVFGSITLDPNMTLAASTQTYTLEGRGSFTLTSAGKTRAKTFVLLALGGTYTMSDAFATTGYLIIDAGTLNLNNNNLTIGRCYSSTSVYTRSLLFGSGVITITDSGPYTFHLGSGMTINAGTGSIVFTDSSSTDKSFDGADKVFNNIRMSGTGTGKFLFTGSNTFNEFRIDPGLTVQFTAGTTTHIWNPNWVGTADQPITITSITAANHTLVLDSGGIISRDYLNISYSQPSTTNQWYAGPNSTCTVGGTCGNWTFTAAPPKGKISVIW